MQFLEFVVGNQIYAMDILDVVSIEDNQKISEVPLPAPYIKGMVMIRDDVMSVYDLAERLCVSDFKEYTDPKYGNMLLVVEHNNKKVAMEITTAKSVVELDIAQVEHVPSTIGRAGNFIKGLINRPEGLVVVIDKDVMFQENNALMYTPDLLLGTSKRDEEVIALEVAEELDLLDSSQLAFA